MTDTARLIEHAFPLKQASLDSVHEKNVRHGHISTLHIWPARRPLAACRAALIAALLPVREDGTPDIDALNAVFSKEYLKDKVNPRWIPKPTVAFSNYRKNQRHGPVIFPPHSPSS